MNISKWLSEYKRKRVESRAKKALQELESTTRTALQNLKSDDEGRRRQALDTLIALKDARAIEPLAELLQDKNYSIREYAAQAMGNIGNRQALQPLLVVLKDRNGDVRTAVERALESIDVNWPVTEEARKAIPLCIAALSDRDDYVRRGAAEALVKIGNAQAVGPLVKALSDSDSGVRKAAAIALEKFGTPESKQALAEYYKQSMTPKQGDGQPEKAAPFAKRHKEDPKRFVDNMDGTITDIITGLVWQKEDDGKERAYDEAMSYCRGLRLAGYSGWRLPTLEEMLSLVVRGTPANIDKAFANAKRERYWTATEFPGNKAETAYTIDFIDGGETSYFKINRYYVRAVRSDRMDQDTLDAHQLFQQGLNHYQAGHFKEAIGQLSEAKKIYSHLGFKELAAYCDVNIGAALGILWQPRRAMEHIEQAKAVYLDLGFDKEVAICEGNIGVILDGLGQPQQAMECLERAKAIFIRLGFDKEVAGCETNIGNALLALGQSLQAMERHRQAQAIFLRLGLEREAATCEINIGNTLLALGRPQQAIEHHKRAKAAFIRLDLEKEVAGCDVNIANSLNELWQLQQAVEHFEWAKTVFLGLGLEREAADCDRNAGVVLSEIGQRRTAIEYFERAKVVFTNLGFENEVAGCDVNIGNALWALGQPQQAIEHLEQAKAVFLRLHLEIRVAVCDTSIGNALYASGQPQKSVEHHERAKAVYLSLGLEKDVARCDRNIGVAFHSLGELHRAMDRFEAAKSVFRRLGFDGDVAVCNMNIGATFESLAVKASADASPALYQKALKYLDDAALTVEQLRTNFTDVSYRVSFFEEYVGIYWAAIRCCLRLGHITDAIHYFERSRSKTLAEAVSSNLIPDQNEIGEQFYAEFLNLRARLRQEGLLPMVKSDFNIKPESNGSGSTRRQAQHDFDTLVQRIAKEFPNSAFTRKLAATEVRYLKEVDEYVDFLPDNRSCLLEFLTWADDGRLRAFLVTKQHGLELLTFPEGSLKQLESLWDDWKEMYGEKLRRKEKADLVLETCHQLHKLIFDAEVQISREGNPDSIIIEPGSRKLRDYLDTTLEVGDGEQHRRMYVIPHSFLFLMPLHAACCDEEAQPRPHYLIDDYVVVYAPSAYLLKVSQEREYPKPQQLRAMVVGNPLPLKDTPSLAFAAYEARAVAKQLKEAGWKVDELIETEATKQRFLNGDQQGVVGINSGAYGHLHQAQHAGISGQGHQVFFCFGQSSEDHHCYDRDIAGAPLQRTKSVVAAACLTSVTSPALNEYLGMGAAFLQAGVGTFIGTIYPLSDEGSSELVPELYRLRLQEGLSWADALRRAQLQIASVAASGASRDNRGPTMTAEKMGLLQKPRPAGRSDSEPEIPLDHPYHWAAFTISGKE